MKKIRMPFAWALALCLAGASVAKDAVAKDAIAETPPAAAKAAPAPAAPKGQATVDKGLNWLATHQLADGGFGQGEESVQMGSGGQLAGVGNVADTSVAAMAFLRSGSSPLTGEYQKNVSRAVDYVLASIEKSDKDSIYVTDVRSTRVQSKLGQAVDTFMALALLTDVQGKMPDAAGEARVKAGVEKIIAKMKKNQRDDGSFETSGWAPTLSQAVGSRGLNKAAEQGVTVPETLRSKAEDWSKDQSAGGKFKGTGSAGVQLYGTASAVTGLGSSVSANEKARPTVEKQVKEGKTKEERDQAQATLRRYDEAKKAEDVAMRAMTEQMKDERFIAGFGNNGGEEFLSYMLMSESLAKKGGKEWDDWRARMNTNLTRVQNGDGSWTGHHCITGRTFVTSTALLVLTTDAQAKSVQERMLGKKAS